MKQPKVSILLPTYNGARWIGETLKSIFSQDFTDFEIIVSDDCSQDNTIETIKSFNDKRIRVYRSKRNLGYGGNLQVLEKLPKGGDILFLMDQDDILLAGALKKHMMLFLWPITLAWWCGRIIGLLIILPGR